MSRAIWGGVLLAAPGTILRAVGGVDDGVAAQRVMRVLGARHLIQAVVVGTTPAARSWGVVVDGLHSCTAAGLAVLSPCWRRMAGADAVLAAGFAAVGMSQGFGSPRLDAPVDPDDDRSRRPG